MRNAGSGARCDDNFYWKADDAEGLVGVNPLGK